MRPTTRPEAFRAHTPAVPQIFALVLSHGPVTRAEIARRAGLSAAAVTKAVRPLVESGHLVEEAGHPVEEAGRRRVGLPADRRARCGSTGAGPSSSGSN